MRTLRVITGGALLATAGTPAFAQTLGRAEDDGVATWRVVTALLICLALAVAGAWALRSRTGLAARWPGAASARRRLRLVESLRLPDQVTISLVACDDVEWLVSTSSSGAALLGPALPRTGLGDPIESRGA